MIACSSPSQAFQTYPGAIAQPTIGPQTLTFNDDGLLGKMVGSFKLAAVAGGGVEGQLASYQTFISRCVVLATCMWSGRAC